MAKSNQKSQKLGKNGNLNYFPTASIKSYWALGSQDPTQFARLLLHIFFSNPYSVSTFDFKIYTDFLGKVSRSQNNKTFAIYKMMWITLIEQGLKLR